MALAEEQRLENPLLAGLPVSRRPEPCAMVIFGASGDLTKRKLFPAIYSLAYRQLLPEKFGIVGVARTEETDDEFRERMKAAVQEFGRDEFRDDVWQWLAEGMHYVSGEEADPVLERVAGLLTELDRERGTAGNRVYYLAVPPDAFVPIVQAVGKRRSTEGWTRLIVEKPFGHDLESAQKLNALLQQDFEESEIYRIDHYLGKETVQNLLALRFANALFEPVWNRNYVDSVQITAAEDIGIEGRAGYYEGAGALRDLVQNHMLRLLALLTIEPPASFEANRLRDEKVKVLEAIVPPRVRDVRSMALRAQYGPGVVGGERVPGYRQEEGVAPDSRTETYAALRLEVSNWRWAGVPFYLRTGKRLSRKVTDIAVTLKPVPHLALQTSGSVGVQPNEIILTVQPDEGVSVSLGAKIPGSRMRIRPVIMEFRYGTSFMSESPEAYERLILDAMRGDATLFTRNDEIEALWGIIDPILTAWQEDRNSPIREYPAGSAGPAAAEALLDGGRKWRRL